MKISFYAPPKILEQLKQSQRDYLHSITDITNLPLQTIIDTKNPADFILAYQQTESNFRLELRNRDYPKTKALTVDFLNGKTRHRRLYGGGKNQNLGKAIGTNKHKNLNVLDTTAGLGNDAFVLATLGCNVTLLERNPIVYSLLNDALLRVQQALKNSTEQETDRQEVADICQRMQLIHSNSVDYLDALKPTDYPDVIYIDPMFPERKKSAAVKKSMQFFQGLLGDDLDADTLLENSLAKTKKRCVVKRPIHAETLLSSRAKPDYQIKGKSVRYDIYISESHSK